MLIVARKFSLFVILILGIGLSASSAQVQATNGSIQGDVTDAGGAVVPGAAVEADEGAPQVDHHNEAAASGHFDFPSLQPGRYVVKISKSGFATTIQENLTLTVGRVASLKLALQVAEASQPVIVTSEPLVDVATA